MSPGQYTGGGMPPDLPASFREHEMLPPRPTESCRVPSRRNALSCGTWQIHCSRARPSAPPRRRSSSDLPYTVSGAKRGNRRPIIDMKSGNRMVRLEPLWTIWGLLVVAAGFARVERRSPLSREVWGSSGAHFSGGRTSDGGARDRFGKFLVRFNIEIVW